MLEAAHVVGISKTTYALATSRCLEWRRGLQHASTNHDPSVSDSQDPCRRPAGRHRGRPRLPGAGVLVLDPRVTHRRPPRDGVAGTWPDRCPDRTVAGPGRPEP